MSHLSKNLKCILNKKEKAISAILGIAVFMVKLKKILISKILHTASVVLLLGIKGDYLAVKVL